MSNALHNLLNQDNERTSAARALGSEFESLTKAMDAYRAAWKRATQLGWARTDLMRAGFIDPARLPRVTRPRNSSESSQTVATNAPE